MTTMTTAPLPSGPSALQKLGDSRIMLRRNLRRMIRYPSMTLMLLGMPILFLLLFVFVFGGTMGDGLPESAQGGGRSAYADYVTPGILLMTIAGIGQGTAISIAMDMTEGIIDRFKTMAIGRSAVLIGHVIGGLIQVAIATTVVIGIALLVGFRPQAGFGAWLLAAGLLALTALAMVWLTVAMGLAASSVETASNTPMFLSLLPLVGSGFVPTETMPAGLRFFAEHQPFTPIMETLRGLLFDQPIGSQGAIAVAWCVTITVLGYLWAVRGYRKVRA